MKRKSAAGGNRGEFGASESTEFMAAARDGDRAGTETVGDALVADALPRAAGDSRGEAAVE